jgi:SAM-dependent methyltransferase
VTSLDPRQRLGSALVELLTVSAPVVLDAGCGHDLHFPVGMSPQVVGVDIDPDAATDNAAIDEFILGDIQTCELPRSRFDVAVCWDVLEHLDQPTLALDNLLGSVRHDGFLVVGVPNVLSPKGLLAKFTPHWFHVWIYRRLLKQPHAGEPGHRPFRTYLRFEIRPAAIERWATSHGLTVVYRDAYETLAPKRIRQRNLLTRAVWALLAAVWPGDATESDYAVILHRH